MHIFEQLLGLLCDPNLFFGCLLELSVCRIFSFTGVGPLGHLPERVPVGFIAQNLLILVLNMKFFVCGHKIR